MEQCALLLIDKILGQRDASWRFFPSVANTMHLWRDMVKQTFDKWVEIHGPTSAQEHAKKTPTKPVVGMWGSVWGCCQRLIVAGESFFSARDRSST